MSDVIRRKRTGPPTKQGWYYQGELRTPPVFVKMPSRFVIDIVWVTEREGKIGIWDDHMEELDPLPDYYVWFGPVPACEEEP